MTQKPQVRLITLHAITFLHPGTGQSTGVIDLPIQREVHTQHPMYAASGLKGALRDKAEQLDKTWITPVFGAASDADDPSAGSMNPTDARILAFPVRSLQAVFTWVTCPMVINRLVRDAALINLDIPVKKGTHELSVSDNEAIVATDSPLKDKLVLEEILFETVKADETVDKLASLIENMIGTGSSFDGGRLVLISDEDFSYLVQHATQISARIKLNDRKTTSGDGGNLWYEETLPPETILYALVLCHKPRIQTDEIEKPDHVAEKLEELCKDRYLQIGGNETVGQGWCYVNLSGN